MKNVIIAASLALFGTAAQANEPNLFDCENEAGDVQVHYTTSSFGGEPTLTIEYQGDVITLNDAIADTDDSDVPVHRRSVTLHVDNTILGKLVSAVSYPLFIADAPSTTYSLFVPTIHTVGNLEEVTFRSQLMIGSLGGFTPATTPVQRLRETHDLECKAKAVAF